MTWPVAREQDAENSFEGIDTMIAALAALMSREFLAARLESCPLVGQCEDEQIVRVRRFELRRQRGDTACGQR